MRHIISILLENESGALSRVAGLFSARGYNIESLSVAPTDDPSLSRMTLVTTGTDEIVEQIIKQLNKLIDVVKLVDLTEGEHIERELMLIKVSTRSRGACDDVIRLADIFGARILDVSDKTYTIEVTDSVQKIDDFIRALDKKQIIEVARSGVIGIARGDKALVL